MSEDTGNTPKKGSSEWNRNEKIINQNPFLKKMRAQSQLESVSEITTGVNSEQYKDNYDAIDWNMDWLEEFRKQGKANE